MHRNASRIVALLLCLVLCLSLTACGRDSTQPAGDELTTFTDSCGRTVEVPARIDRVAVSGPLAQIVVFALAPDKMVGVSNEWTDVAKEYIPAPYTDLPLLGQLYGGKGELNLETLLDTGAQVVIDVGDQKDGIVDDMNALQEQTGIPFVHIDAPLSRMDETYTMLGQLLGMPDEAGTLSEYCRHIYDRTVDIASHVEKVDLLYLTGNDHVIAKDSYHAEVIDLLSNNLAQVESPSSKGSGNEVDMEQILLWNPDYILFAPDCDYEAIAADSAWQQVTAIAEGHYCQVPEGPYNWMGFPPSAQRLLGMIWMAHVLYPTACDYDLYDEVAQYFQLFYHMTLTQEQFDTLTANANM